jgi:nucleoside-diphosphate-sugar epimerase
VAVLGGTGLIGWHTVNALRERGHGIRVFARSAPRPALGIGSTEYLQLNYINPRVAPKGRADTFFHDINVTANQRLLLAAVEAKVTVTVLLTSYFHPLRPHMKNHPYVASRIASEAAAMELDSAGDIRVVILQPPYVFGAIPGRTTLGDNFALAARVPLLLPHGGTNAIGVSDFASATIPYLSSPRLHQKCTLTQPHLKRRLATHVATYQRQLRLLPENKVPISRQLHKIVHFVPKHWVLSSRRRQALAPRPIYQAPRFPDRRRVYPSQQ